MSVKGESMADKTTRRVTTSWMWPIPDGVHGLTIDEDEGIFHWYDQLGCACGDSYLDQPLTAFVRDGVPGGMAGIPDDVMAEIRVAVAWLQTLSAPE